MLTLAASVLYGLYQVLYKRYIALPSDPESTAESGHYRSLPVSANNTVDEETATTLRADDIVYPPPFGLHANLITATIGLCTLLVFWIPIPLLHYYQIETFRLPPNGSTVMAIAGIAASGVVFNAGFMVCHGLLCTWRAQILWIHHLTDTVGNLGPHRDIGWEPTYHSPDTHL